MERSCICQLGRWNGKERENVPVDDCTIGCTTHDPERADCVQSICILNYTYTLAKLISKIRQRNFLTTMQLDTIPMPIPP